MARCDWGASLAGPPAIREDDAAPSQPLPDRPLTAIERKAIDASGAG